MARNNEKCVKCQINTVVPGFWQEKGKTWKMRYTHLRTWNMARYSEKLKKREIQPVGTGIRQEN